MGIVNLTPDSFSQDGRLQKSSDPNSHLRFAKKLVSQGADILDLGAESSRPGARTISIKEELKRLMPALKLIVKHLKVPVSVDTYKLEVAQESLDAGASIINNIHGTKLNKQLLKAIKSSEAAIVLMHMRGNSRNMQQKTVYKNIIKEIIEELRPSVEKCLGFGINKDRIIIDPGIGFAKNAQQNLEIIRELSKFHIFGCPILIGPSRKSFIGQVLGKPAPERLMGTAAAISLGIAKGADIVRVHDVAQMKDVVLVTDAIINKRVKS
jgi:dihydropteroate synthase